jgi:predicted ATPase
MFLSRFGVKNYKCLVDVDIPLTPIHVLIGQNDAGKTSLLEAMAALYASSEKEVRHGVFPEPWEGRELVFHGSKEPEVEFSAEWTASESEKSVPPQVRYGFVVKFPPHARECISHGEWIEVVNKQQRQPLSSGTSPNTIVRRLKQEGRIPDSENLALGARMLVPFLSPAHKYAFNPNHMAIPAKLHSPRKFRMDPDGRGLPTLLDDILGYDAKRFIHLREEFCHFFPQFTSVRVETEGSLKGIRFECRSSETLRAQQASDGAILFLAYLALAHLPDPPKLLLIEEPENGIYPKRLGEVIKMLKEMVYRSEGIRFPQIILSTHSPYVLSFFEPEEVTFLSQYPGAAGDGVRARPLREAPNIKERLGDEFVLGELWYNLSEEELFGEP